MASTGNRALYDLCIRLMADVVHERTAAAARMAQIHESIAGTAEGLVALHNRISQNAGFAASRSVHPAGEEFMAAMSAQAVAVAVGLSSAHGAISAGDSYRVHVANELAQLERNHAPKPQPVEVHEV